MTKKTNNFSIKQWPEGERPREKLIQFGAELLTDAELLAIPVRSDTGSHRPMAWQWRDYRAAESGFTGAAASDNISGRPESNPPESFSGEVVSPGRCARRCLQQSEPEIGTVAANP